MAQLLSNLPIGSKVKFGKYSVNGEPAEPITWLIVAKNHTCTPAYPAASSLSSFDEQTTTSDSEPLISEYNCLP